MSRLVIHGGRPLAGTVTPPADKSITHRALILGALARGTSRIAAAGVGADNLATAHVLRALGVAVRASPQGFEVEGVGGPSGLRPPEGPLDCANSGTTLRLMAGVLAGAPFTSVLTGDASLLRRPTARLAPLVAMGAGLEGTTPPLTVRGGPLVGAAHRLPVASAQVKSALLLAGLFAQGETRVWEPGRSRDHTERLLGALGAGLAREPDGTLVLRPLEGPLPPLTLEVAPDFSGAAFFLAASALLPGSRVQVRAGVNPLRTGFLDALEALGVAVRRRDEAQAGGEPVATLDAHGPPARGAEIRDPVSLRAIDELPLVAVVAAGARGRTVIADAAELRVKESDRIARVVALLEAFGVPAAATADGLTVEGGGPLVPAEVDAGDDHRLAMCAAVLGLAAPGTTVVRGAEIIGVSFPGFVHQMQALGARLELDSEA